MAKDGEQPAASSEWKRAANSELRMANGLALTLTLSQREREFSGVGARLAPALVSQHE
jgi:hypothetical protein